jgi:hypothetical protein
MWKFRLCDETTRNFLYCRKFEAGDSSVYTISIMHTGPVINPEDVM